MSSNDLKIAMDFKRGLSMLQCSEKYRVPLSEIQAAVRRVMLALDEREGDSDE